MRDSLWPNGPDAISKIARSQMTSQPEPNQPEGANPLPPRHRPNLNELGKTTTEADLWSLDDDLDSDGPAPDEPLRSQRASVPEPRQRMAAANPVETSDQSREVPPAQREQADMDAGKPWTVPAGEKKSPAIISPYGELDDLEAWDDESAATGMGGILPAAAAASVPSRPAAPQPSSLAEEPRPLAGKPPGAVEPEAISAGPRQTAGAATPHAPRPRLGLSGFERIGMTVLGVLLLAGAIYFYVFSVKRLPSETQRAENTDFPIEGERMSVEAADTGWRVPVIEGADADTVRRGTQLIPEIRMEVKGHGALRVLFRDDQRQFVGDAVTREVDGEESLRIPATAGFEDVGMYAAYRTGGTKPWTASVYEGESVNSPGSGFKLLFEMNISTERR